MGDGYDNILQLQRRCVFPYFHGSRFPGQVDLGEKCYLFKMSTKGPASRVDLVNCMRRTGTRDLRNAWVHFDHTHRIEGWATISCSVYDPRYVFFYNQNYMLGVRYITEILTYLLAVLECCR